MFKTLSPLLLLLFLTTATAAEEEFPGIESLMTPAERAAAGIDTLSPAQIEALNTWLERYTGDAAATPQRPAAASTPVTESVPASVPSQAAPANPRPQVVPDDDFRQPREKVDFVSRIAGEFNGWDGRTRFTLENGQVWEQRRGNRWKITLDNPEVRIWENFMGAFEMEVISEGRSIGVRRIR